MECDESNNKRKGRQKCEANNPLKNQQADIEKLSIGVDVRKHEDKTYLNDVRLPGERLEKKIKLGDPQQPNQVLTSKISIDEPSEWQQIFNMNICNDQNAHILEANGKYIHSSVQSSCALEPAKPHFKIKLLNFDYFKYLAVGISCKGDRIDKIPGLYGQSVGFDSCGDFIVNNKSKNVGTKWKVGDVIECGIDFPTNFSKSESVRAKLHFTKNEQLVVETRVLIPKNGYFPTIYIHEGIMGNWWNNGSLTDRIIGTGTKVKYFK